MKKIIFTPTFDVEKSFFPEPAVMNLPDWYKKTDPFYKSKKIKIDDGQRNSTIKKCIPVFDAISAGYIIKTYVDIYVEQESSGIARYHWPSLEPITFHPIEQASIHPDQNGHAFPKWKNPWSIKTEPGYSCLFISPMHNPNNFFTVLPGIVDTDQYINPVNLPFTLNDRNFEGIIPAGTPMVQVIPFKRDSFKLSVGNKKDIERVFKFSLIYNNRFVNNYKSKFWNKKEYR